MLGDNMKQNKDILDEVNKGAVMGMDAIKDILPKVEDKVFKEVLDGEYEKYKTISKRIEEIYDDYAMKEDEPRETSPANKVMTKMMVDMKTIKDTSNSKLAELLMQGTNMGIIEGRRLLNQKDHIDEEVYEILKDFVEMQEDSIETLKKYL